MKKEKVRYYRERQLRKANLKLSKFHTEEYINKMMNDRKAIINFINAHDYYIHRLLKVENYMPPHKSFFEWVKVEKAKLRIKYKVWRMSGFKYKR